jgi:hypothetical protein
MVQAVTEFASRVDASQSGPLGASAPSLRRALDAEIVKDLNELEHML